MKDATATACCALLMLLLLAVWLIMGLPASLMKGVQP